MSIFSKHLPAIHVPHYKNTMDMPTEKMPVPDQIIISMAQNIGAPCKPLVQVGNQVKIGQIIGDSDAFVSAPIHCGVSGTVESIELLMTTSGNRDEVVFIKPDHRQEVHESIKPPIITNREDFIKAVHDAGLVGLGGAAFPTHVKYNPPNPEKVDTLVINGAECEPFITSDYRTMIEDSENIIYGIKQVMQHLQLKHCYIGIESNKAPAISKLQELTKDMPQIEIKNLRSSYPQGAERVLIYETTGKTLPLGKLPADIGIIVSNITSVATLAEYLKTGMPLIKKKITVDGPAINNPKNIEVLIGTTIADVVDFCGGYKTEVHKIIMGGPMMGRAVYGDHVPIIKNNNAILLFDKSWAKLPKEGPCINCGRCIKACPMYLLPTSINKAYDKGDVEELQELNVLLCMDCGSCSYVCPAKKQLSFVNRFAKEMVKKGEQKS